jgi:hypothetical protein
MIVILTNGARIKIPKEIGQQIMQVLLKDRKLALEWHCFVDPAKNELTGFNFAHVAAVCSEEDIL